MKMTVNSVAFIPSGRRLDRRKEIMRNEYYVVKDKIKKGKMEVELFKVINKSEPPYNIFKNTLVAFSCKGACILTKGYRKIDKMRVLSFIETYDLTIPENL